MSTTSNLLLSITTILYYGTTTTTAHFQSHNVLGVFNRLEFDLPGEFGVRENQVLHHMEQQSDPLHLGEFFAIFWNRAIAHCC